MYPTFRIAMLALAVLTMASFAIPYSCFDGSCGHTACDASDCGDCGVSGHGTLDVAVTADPECTSDGNGCSSANCASGDDLSAQGTLSYLYTGGGTPTQRTILVCEGWIACDDVMICKRCSIVYMTPATPRPATYTMPVSECDSPGEGVYQYHIRAQDITGYSCPCVGAPCENGCASWCQNSVLAIANGCCITLP